VHSESELVQAAQASEGSDIFLVVFLVIVPEGGWTCGHILIELLVVKEGKTTYSNTLQLLLHNRCRASTFLDSLDVEKFSIFASAVPLNPDKNVTGWEAAYSKVTNYQQPVRYIGDDKSSRVQLVYNIAEEQLRGQDLVPEELPPRVAVMYVGAVDVCLPQIFPCLTDVLAQILRTGPDMHGWSAQRKESLEPEDNTASPLDSMFSGLKTLLWSLTHHKYSAGFAWFAIVACISHKFKNYAAFDGGDFGPVNTWLKIGNNWFSPDNIVKHVAPGDKFGTWRSELTKYTKLRAHRAALEEKAKEGELTKDEKVQHDILVLICDRKNVPLAASPEASAKPVCFWTWGYGKTSVAKFMTELQIA
jgi:hypothetical protein